MLYSFNPFVLLFFLLSLTSCVSYKISTEEINLKIQEPKGEVCVEKAHWLYQIIPRHRSRIKWYDLGHWTTWAILGNDDGGLFGEGHPHPYEASSRNSVGKALKWGLRNPMHNFCYYVIGTAYWTNSEFTLFEISSKNCRFFQYHPRASRVFASKGTGLLITLHGWKPFVSLRLRYSKKYKGDFYLGWRYRGNFGIKFVPWTRSK